MTTRVEDPGLVPELEAAHIRFTGHVANTWLSTLLSWILPSVIFVGLWMFVMKRMNPQSGLMSLGKSRAKVWCTWRIKPGSRSTISPESMRPAAS